VSTTDAGNPRCGVQADGESVGDAHRLATGSRIRLQVSGGAYPRWARNLGTDKDPATGTRLASSHRTICHGTADGSGSSCRAAISPSLPDAGQASGFKGSPTAAARA
jgi:hypothetical protein